MTNILVVDDNENNRLTLELLLEEIEDVAIIEAENGNEAIRACLEKHFDLIFMDIMMPEMDGIEATFRIKEFSKSSMIIALSALDDKESKQKILLAGAEDYLTKPIDSELFLQRIRNYINIITLRKKYLDNQEAINPFSTCVFDRVIKFHIKNEESVVQFWDFFLSANILPYQDISDYVRIVYGLSLWLLKRDVKFSIEVEGNTEAVFIMLNETQNIKTSILVNILKRHLPEADYLIERNRLSFKIAKIEEKTSIVTDEKTKNILSKTHYENPTAAQYVQETAISFMPKIESLEEMEDQLNQLIMEFEKNPSKESMESFCEQLDEYCGVVELLNSFDHLAFAIKSLLDFLRSLEGEKFQTDKIPMFTSLILTFLSDLESWRDLIFIKQEAIDIHYLDASLLSSCLQIEAIFEETSVDEGDDLEFF